MNFNKKCLIYFFLVISCYKFATAVKTDTGFPPCILESDPLRAGHVFNMPNT